ncbi:MAG TPA: PRC-barrel domain-containing protein [Ktedonobacteraceae bacterium]|jgi:uncharacterized protein YrrD|nr:PRC-barrel domain-containing protein [Ktedonobacteraceae bacterium]
MDNHNHTTRKWSDVYKMQAYVPQEGRTLGVVDDFYFKPGTNAIYALGVSTRINGERALPVTGIKEVGSEHIDLVNAQMLTHALPPLPRGQELRGKKVVNETGKELGTVGDVWLATEHPTTLRIAAIEVQSASGRRARTFTAGEIASYTDDAVIVYDR